MQKINIHAFLSHVFATLIDNSGAVHCEWEDINYKVVGGNRTKSIDITFKDDRLGEGAEWTLTIAKYMDMDDRLDIGGSSIRIKNIILTDYAGYNILVRTADPVHVTDIEADVEYAIDPVWDLFVDNIRLVTPALDVIFGEAEASMAYPA